MSELLRASQLLGDVCPQCGAIKKSSTPYTCVSTRIGNRNISSMEGLVKRFHRCKVCEARFNTIAIREDQLEQLLSLINELLKIHHLDIETVKYSILNNA